MDSKLPAAYATHTVNILRVSAGHRKAALAALEDLEGDIVRKIEKASTINKQARLNALLDQTRGSISQTYAAIAAGHGKDLLELAAVESAFTRKSMGQAIGADIFGVAVSANQLEKAADGKTIFGHSSAEWWKNQDTALQYKFRGTMQQGFLAGETNEELVRRVRGTKANNFNDGVMSASRRDATALVRTAAISTANSARLATLEAMQDVVKGIMWCCFVAGTMVEQEDKCTPIEQLKLGDQVISGTGMLRKITGISRHKSTKMAKLKLSNGQVLICTADHRFLTERGWVQAQHLNPEEPFAFLQ